MAKKSSNRPRYDDDGERQTNRSDIKRDREQKRQRNLYNALKGKKLDVLVQYEDEE